jgi:hypothetical protein
MDFFRVRERRACFGLESKGSGADWRRRGEVEENLEHCWG